jgi:hypothetical protein
MIMVSQSSGAVIDMRNRRYADGALFLDLVGPFRLRDAEGRNLTPKGRKAQGLLALLATSPDLRRARAWLQDKLWSDRGSEQGASSLRQCLTEIRLALGTHVGCLQADRGWVALDPVRVHVNTGRGRTEAEDVEFLEGLDIRDPEFENWVRDQRMSYSERHCRGLARAADATGEPVGPGDTRATLSLVARPAAGGLAGPLADEMLDLVAGALVGNSTVSVVDLREQRTLGAAPTPSEGWLLCAASSVWRSRVRIALTLTEVGASRLHWTEAATFDVAEFYVREPLAVGAFAGRAADFVLSRILVARSAPGRSERGEPLQRLLGQRAAGSPGRPIGRAPVARLT